jgi:hypothetical protein
MSERLKSTMPEIIHASIIDDLVATATKAVNIYNDARPIPIQGGKPMTKFARLPGLAVTIPTEEFATAAWKAEVILSYQDGRAEENFVIRDNNSIAKLYYDGRPIDYMTTAEAYALGLQLEAVVNDIESDYTAQPDSQSNTG